LAAGSVDGGHGTVVGGGILFIFLFEIFRVLIALTGGVSIGWKMWICANCRQLAGKWLVLVQKT
jgi:hypothetical protein